MNHFNDTLIRAWKDADFRASLNNAELQALPSNPVGPSELSDTELGFVPGAVLNQDPQPLTIGRLCDPLRTWLLSCNTYLFDCSAWCGGGV